MAVWLTSDTHFGHANIIRPDYCDRPFKDVHHMNEVLIANWNAKVGPKDDIYHLGDVCLGDPDKFLPRLNGRKYLILGNHDHKLRNKLAPYFEWVKEVYKLRVEGHRLWLSHYAHRSWPRSHHGTIHLFGHSHGDMPDHGKSTDVGVDAWDYSPVSLKKILDHMQGRVKIHHHEKIRQEKARPGESPYSRAMKDVTSA